MFYEISNERYDLEQELPAYQAVYDRALEEFLDFRYSSKYRHWKPVDYAKHYKKLESRLDAAAAAWYSAQAMLKQLDWKVIELLVNDVGYPEPFIRELYLGEHVSERPSTFNPYFEAGKPHVRR